MDKENKTSSPAASAGEWLGWVTLLVAVAGIGGWMIWIAYRPATAAGFISDVPNVDWKDLDRAGRQRATRIMNEQGCDCGCGMTIAKCRRDDQSCPRSPGVAAGIIAAVQSGKPDDQILAAAPPPGEPPEEPVDDSTIPRVKLDLEGAVTVGPSSAPVTLVEFVDYQCPYCSRANQVVEQVREKYGEKLRVAFLQNPLNIHDQAPLASEAALAAAAQGKFIEMHNRLFEQQNRLSPEDLVEHAREVGLDVKEFKAALDSHRFKQRVDADLEQANRRGVNSTPFFFINGRPLVGAQPIQAFESLINEELAGELKPARWLEQVPGRR